MRFEFSERKVGFLILLWLLKDFAASFFFKHGPLTMIRAVAVASSHGRGGVVDNAADSCSRVLGSILAVITCMKEAFWVYRLCDCFTTLGSNLSLICSCRDNDSVLRQQL